MSVKSVYIFDLSSYKIDRSGNITSTIGVDNREGELTIGYRMYLRGGWPHA